jgi:hypothetical protein
MAGRGWSSPVLNSFGFDGIPFNVLIGADGRVVGTNVRGEGLLRALDALLGDPIGDGPTAEQRPQPGSRR